MEPVTRNCQRCRYDILIEAGDWISYEGDIEWWCRGCVVDESKMIGHRRRPDVVCQECRRSFIVNRPLLSGPYTCLECVLQNAIKGRDDILVSLQKEKMTSEPPIAQTCDEIKAMLLEKNKAYGDSAMNPLRVFSKADAVEQLKVRIDDKLSRILRGSNAGEDVILDLIGYLILLRIATKEQGK